jgi:phospholipid transport system substrate-binding protein
MLPILLVIGRQVLLVHLVSIFLIFSSLTVGADRESVEAATQRYVTDLLTDLRAAKPLYDSDQAAYFNEVEDALSRFVDFREVARGVMARYTTGARGATSDQLDRFAEVFRSSMVEFYGSALANYDAQTFELLPIEQTAEDPLKNSLVRMSIGGASGFSFEVLYVMFLDDQNQWKMKNLFVEGVNLRRQYYAQFDSLMRSNNYNIDAVIDQWKLQ